MTGPDLPQLCQTVVEARDVRRLAEFYRLLLGLVYRPGDEPPTSGPDDADWLVLRHPDGSRALAIEENRQLVRPTWPDAGIPQQLHLDLTVSDLDQLRRQRDRAVELGAVLALDRSDDPDEPLYVLRDPAGHPFCIFVA